MKQQSSRWASVIPALFSFFGILALILDAKTAVSSAAEGLQLCLQTVVPSLFPFLVAARLFLRSGAAQWCTRAVGPIMEPIFGLPPQGASALVLGMLSGYPVGAQTAASLYASGQLTKEETERLLGFAATPVLRSYSAWSADCSAAGKLPPFCSAFTSSPPCSPVWFSGPKDRL